MLFGFAGFTPDQFKLSTGFGSGRVYVDGMTASSVAVQAGGCEGAGCWSCMQAPRVLLQGTVPAGASLSISPCELCRNGPVVLSGSFGAVDVATVNGISTVFLDGVRDRASLDLSGISNVYVTPTSSTTQIGGR